MVETFVTYKVSRNILACCNVSGCECPAGTIIDEDRNECVSPDKCPSYYPLPRRL